MAQPPRTVIVGAGIAGLWIADRLVTAGVPGKSITILEKYDYDGGRILTATGGYEIGAGRIHESHRLTNALVDRFGLTRGPHNPAVDWRPLATLTSVPNRFEAAWRAVSAVMPPSPHHTVRDLVKGTSFETLLEQYPYRAETERMRADLAIPTFSPRGEMGTREGYFSLREGLSAIVRGLTDVLKKAGVRFRYEAEVTNVEREHTGDIYEISIKSRATPLRAERVILAIPVSALRRLPVMRDCEPLRHLTMAPLTRIYAEYPPSPSTGTVWFADIRRTVTDSPLRYIIPINPAKGLIMISYTDDRDTSHWHGLKGPRLQAEVRRLWPALEIPEPTWIRPYEWHDGCTYWMPGDYDPVAESRRMLRPRPATMPELYVCGESFSVGRQAWIEGALEHAELLWETHLKSYLYPL